MFSIQMRRFSLFMLNIVSFVHFSRLFSNFFFSFPSIFYSADFFFHFFELISFFSRRITPYDFTILLHIPASYSIIIVDKIWFSFNLNNSTVSNVLLILFRLPSNWYGHESHGAVFILAAVTAPLTLFTFRSYSYIVLLSAACVRYTWTKYKHTHAAEMRTQHKPFGNGGHKRPRINGNALTDEPYPRLSTKRRQWLRHRKR